MSSNPSSEVSKERFAKQVAYSRAIHDILENEEVLGTLEPAARDNLQNQITQYYALVAVGEKKIDNESVLTPEEENKIKKRAKDEFQALKKVAKESGVSDAVLKALDKALDNAKIQYGNDLRSKIRRSFGGVPKNSYESQVSEDSLESDFGSQISDDSLEGKPETQSSLVDTRSKSYSFLDYFNNYNSPSSSPEQTPKSPKKNAHSQEIEEILSPEVLQLLDPTAKDVLENQLSQFRVRVGANQTLTDGSNVTNKHTGLKDEFQALTEVAKQAGLPSNVLGELNFAIKAAKLHYTNPDNELLPSSQKSQSNSQSSSQNSQSKETSDKPFYLDRNVDPKSSKISGSPEPSESSERPSIELKEMNAEPAVAKSARLKRDSK